MEKLCVIFGAGETVSPRKKFGKDDLIVAADGGFAAATEAGLSPSVVIGDFDSGKIPENTAAHIIKLSRDKDDTDMLAAVKLGLRRGYKNFVIYGGTGGRNDHTFANIATLAYLNAFSARGFLVGKDETATVFTDGTFVLPTVHGTVSVFAYGGAATGVTLKNLSYELNDAELLPEMPIGVSNATVGTGRASVSVKHGTLLVFFPRK